MIALYSAKQHNSTCLLYVYFSDIDLARSLSGLFFASDLNSTEAQALRRPRMD
jgi:hypothetical protein